MGTKTTTKHLTHEDFPAYVAKQQLMTEVNAKRVDCLARIAAAREALDQAKTQAGGLPTRASSIQRQAAALLGDKAPDHASVATKQQELDEIEHDLVVIDAAIAQLSRDMQKLRRDQAGEIVRSHASDIRAEQAEVIATGLAYTRAVAKARARIAELETMDVGVGGTWAPPVGFEPGAFADPYSPVCQMLQLARESGMTVPEVPEIIAARRKEDERARELAERDQQQRAQRPVVGQQMNEISRRGQLEAIGEQIS